MANNTVPKQTYLYQRYMDDFCAKYGPTPSPMRMRRENSDTRSPEVQEAARNIMKRVQKESSNLDIEFSDVDEAQQMDECSPMPRRRKVPSQTQEGPGNVGSGLANKAKDSRTEKTVPENEHDRCIKGIPIDVFIKDV